MYHVVFAVWAGLRYAGVRTRLLFDTGLLLTISPDTPRLLNETRLLFGPGFYSDKYGIVIVFLIRPKLTTRTPNILYNKYLPSTVDSLSKSKSNCFQVDCIIEPAYTHLISSLNRLSTHKQWTAITLINSYQYIYLYINIISITINYPCFLVHPVFSTGDFSTSSWCLHCSLCIGGQRGCEQVGTLT